MILAGDIGGTKVNLALFEVKDQKLIEGIGDTYRSRDYTSLTDILRDFLAKHQVKPDYASFGIAGPVKRGRSQLTNLNWKVDVRELIEQLGFRYAWLVNDLEANAYGIAALERNDFFLLNEGETSASGNAAIISAGTGLGEAGLFWDGHRHLPLACEGGHCDFSPRTDLDLEIFKFLRVKFGKVSWERLLSGPGFVNIYEFLRDTGRGEEPAWLKEEMQQTTPAAAITRAALAHKAPICIEAMEMFATYYGAEASNLALKIMSTGGLYIGGGIAPKILEKLKDGTFMKSFNTTGRMQYLLEAMPVRVILNERTALLGAGRLAAAQAGWIR